MKEKKIFLILTIITLLFSYAISEKNSKKYGKGTESFTREDYKGFRHNIDERIKNAIETGLITKEQGEELLKQKKEVEDYKTAIWQDDMMTKEEKEKLDTMNKDFKEKMHSVLETAMKQWEEKRNQKKHMISMIKRALDTGKITQKEADILTKKVDELEKLEAQIWADDIMTKDEHDKFQQAKISLRQELKKLFSKNKIKKMRKFKHMNEQQNCYPEKSHLQKNILQEPTIRI